VWIVLSPYTLQHCLECILLGVRFFAQTQLACANIESSPVWDTSCLAELIYDRINEQFLCGKGPKPGRLNIGLPCSLLCVFNSVTLA